MKFKKVKIMPKNNDKLWIIFDEAYFTQIYNAFSKLDLVVT